MKIKAIELTGQVLDWTVAYCLDFQFNEGTISIKDGMVIYRTRNVPWAYFSPHRGWEHGGSIIDKHGISIIRCDDDYETDEKGYTTNKRIPVWAATYGHHGTTSSTEHQHHNEMFQIGVDEVVYGPTALVAAMRCFVIMKLSNSRWNLDMSVEIEVPDELIKG